MKDNGHHYGGKGFQPLMVVLITIYLVFAVALAHTAYVALQGRSTAAQGLAASSTSISAFSELKEQIAELKQQLSEAQHSMAAAANQSSTQFEQHLQQLKQELAQDVQNTTHASLLSHASKVDEQFSKLQGHISSIDNKIKEPPAAPVGARVEENELHHIATHHSVCDKGGASGLSLNVSGELIAPLVIVGHNRPGYLTKTMMILLK